MADSGRMALCKFATIDLPVGDEPLLTFRARVKHLLHLDRSGRILGNPADPPPVAHALSADEPGGTGVDAAFTAFDAFCLGLAVDLLRDGFKPRGVILLMAHLRPHLEAAFAGILRAPAPFGPRDYRLPATGAALAARASTPRGCASCEQI